MKGLKKCFYFCVTLMVVSLVYCLVFVSDKSYALKYSYDAYSVMERFYGYSPNSNLGTRIGYGSSVLSVNFGTSDVTLPSGKFHKTGWDSNSNRCLDVTNIQTNIFRRQSNNTIDSDPSFIRTTTDFLPGATDSSAYNALVSAINCYNFMFDDSPSYDFDSFYAGTINVSTGDYDKFISISDEYGIGSSGDLKSISIPLHLSQEKIGTIPSGTPLSWTFELFSDYPLSDIDSNPNIQMSISYWPQDPTTYVGTISNFINSRASASATCSYEANHEFLKVNDDLTFQHLYGYKVDCSYSSTSPMSYVFVTLNVGSATKLFHFDQYLYFATSYVITNNDSTWSGLTANDSPTGANLELAPGYADLYCDNGAVCSGGDGDWFSSLTNLFGFNFLNPFAPMFQLFTDNSECVSIPIISGMLHAEQSTYCPWFDSNTRSILTPVLGIASVMLVFGFLVRWLGASSGNMFEDSSSEVVSNVNHSGFRRYKK